MNCEIGFQDLEKVLNLAKMYIHSWKVLKSWREKKSWSFWTESSLPTLI